MVTIRLMMMEKKIGDENENAREDGGQDDCYASLSGPSVRLNILQHVVESGFHIFKR